MKNVLNLSQLLFLSHNGNNELISNYFDFDFLLDSFFTHIQDFFDSSNMTLHIHTPLWSHELSSDSQTTPISLNNTELGNLSILHPSIYEISSLVYNSSTGLLEIIILSEQLFLSYSINDYLSILNEFAAMLIGEKAFYDHLNKMNGEN